jgi:peroxiredoxin-like protein
MDQTHKFRVVAWWSSGRTGIAKSDSAPNAIQFTAPVAFGGFEGRWTPEDLLLGAIASCFTTTFRALAERSTFEYTDLQMEVEGIVIRNSTGYSFTEIVVRPSLTVARKEEEEQGLKLLHKANAVCLVSRALAVPQKFAPAVTAAAPVLIGDKHVPA